MLCNEQKLSVKVATHSVLFLISKLNSAVVLQVWRNSGGKWLFYAKDEPFVHYDDTINTILQILILLKCVLTSTAVFKYKLLQKIGNRF